MVQMFKIHSELDGTSIYFDMISPQSFNLVKDDYSNVRQLMQP